MVELQDIDIGNWFLFAPDNKYCIVEAKGINLTMVDYRKSKFHCYIKDLVPIGITTDKLSVSGFKDSGSYFVRTSSLGSQIKLTVQRNNVYNLSLDDGNAYGVLYIHQLQNVYFKLTGERLEPNLYGVREN